MAGGTLEEFRYWAFVSYSHKDSDFAHWLHKKLENYSLPRKLRTQTPGRKSLTRLWPIFKDREEFPAAGDLTVEIRKALAQSKSLIVVCSPSVTRSLWVSREIECFRQLRPNGAILAALCKGNPDDSFPTPLLSLDQLGGRSAPLAADFRGHGADKHLALLKIVAGVTGIGLNELAQRDIARQRKRVMAVTVCALGLVLLMAAFTAAAVQARREAELQRNQAQGLIDFMLTDLRTKLEGVGRLDIMSAVNQRALSYYFDQDIRSLSVRALERRARILHLMGADDVSRNDYKAANLKFSEALRTTAALLRQSPNDPERIFAQAQSEYWTGYANYMQYDYKAAYQAFYSYLELAKRLISIAPSNPRYRMELGYANGNLCAVQLLQKTPEVSSAVHFCTDALRATKTAASILRMSPDSLDALIDRHAWLADAYRAQNKLELARQERLIEDQILHKRMISDPKNMDLKDSWIALQRALSLLDKDEGQKARSQQRLLSALQVVRQLIAFDPKNADWKKDKARIENDLLDNQSRRVQR